MHTTIVTTTINVPVLLRAYAENARRWGHEGLDFIVIGDRKTPPETAAFCKTVPRYPCVYLDLEAQQAALERLPRLWSHLPCDSIQRRNIGMLLAYERGADVIITIDDDNFVMDHDFVGLHRLAGSAPEVPAYGSSTGWLNVCSFLEADHGVSFYHRGFPSSERWMEERQFVSCSRAARKVAVNAGLWIDNPDIDAVTRMERQVVVRGLKSSHPETFTLHPGTWSPFNSQNTALIREAVPAYFLSPYIGRYDDIWASYIVTRIAQHLGHAIGFGLPLVRQDRNPHDLWKDIDAERNGMIMTDEFCGALRSLPLTGATYHECFGEIVEGLGRCWNPSPKWTESQKEWRSRLIEGMHIWHEVFAHSQVPMTIARGQ